MGLFTEVEAPVSRAGVAVNLLASAERPKDEGDRRWMSGLAWRSELCPEVQGFNPCVEQTVLPELGDRGMVYYEPVGYRVADECSVMSGRPDLDRAQRQAERIASYVVARELWTGALSALDPYDTPGGGVDVVNAHLGSATATVLTAVPGDIMTGLARLEEAARDKALGAPVFLHAPISLVNQVAQNLTRVGNELRTATDGIVVADAGYPGTGPAGSGDDWMYATGPVAARLGPINADVAPASTVDRTMNTRTVIADRLFAVTFDPCVHFAINVTAE